MGCEGLGIGETRPFWVLHPVLLTPGVKRHISLLRLIKPEAGLALPCPPGQRRLPKVLIALLQRRGPHRICSLIKTLA